MWDIVDRADEGKIDFSHSWDMCWMNYNHRDEDGKLLKNSWVAYRQEQEDKEK